MEEVGVRAVDTAACLGNEGGGSGAVVGARRRDGRTSGTASFSAALKTGVGFARGLPAVRIGGNDIAAAAVVAAAACSCPLSEAVEVLELGRSLPVVGEESTTRRRKT